METSFGKILVHLQLFGLACKSKVKLILIVYFKNGGGWVRLHNREFTSHVLYKYKLCLVQVKHKKVRIWTKAKTPEKGEEIVAITFPSSHSATYQGSKCIPLGPDYQRSVVVTPLRCLGNTINLLALAWLILLSLQNKSSPQQTEISAEAKASAQINNKKLKMYLSKTTSK